MSGLKEVELVSTGVFLPGKPVPFDQIEEVIGHLDQAPPRIQKMINKLRPTVKELIGIEECYFAVDPATKKITESNASMTVKAVQAALQKAKMEPNDIDCLLMANPLPDHQTPPTTTLVQQELGIEKCVEIEVHSNCSGATKVIQIAFDGLRLGRFKNAAVVYSQLSSAYIHADHYNQKKIKPENLLLRWFLSDSASAFILSAKDNIASGIKMTDVYNESVGLNWDPAMWFPMGAKNSNLLEAYEKGYHHLGQNYSVVVNSSEYFFVNGFKRMLAQSNINAKEIDHLIATIPSTKLLNKAKQVFAEEFSLAPEKWYSTVDKKGYSGGATVMIALDDMIKKNLFKPGETLACMTIESSKWMFGGFLINFLSKI